MVTQFLAAKTTHPAHGCAWQALPLIPLLLLLASNHFPTGLALEIQHLSIPSLTSVLATHATASPTFGYVSVEECK